MVTIILMAATPTSAQTFLLTGELDDGDSPASGVFTVQFELLNEAGTVVWSETQAAVVVVGGVFAVDVGALEVLPADVSAAATLQVTVNEDRLAPFPLTRLVSAERTDLARVADSANDAAALDGHPLAELVQRAAVAVAGGPVVPFASISQVPADIADGDQGVDVRSAGNGLAFANRTLSLASVSGTRFAVGAIAGTQLGGIDGTRIAPAAVTGAKVGADLTQADLSQGIRNQQVSGKALFRVSAANCKQAADSLMTRSTCDAQTCVVPNQILAGRVGCNDSTCSLFNPSTCTNASAFFLVAE